MASNIANSRNWEDAHNLTIEAWATVILPDKDIAAYQMALDKAKNANALMPNEPGILDTLGAAQYRIGAYEDALVTLTKTDKIRIDTDEGPDPGNLAFMAMTLYRLGRAEEAKAALGQLRELCKQEQLVGGWALDVQGLLDEAEKLLAGKEQ
jgi:tetratricopeptide (TPR) repeat protein